MAVFDQNRLLSSYDHELSVADALASRVRDLHLCANQLAEIALISATELAPLEAPPVNELAIRRLLRARLKRKEQFSDDLFADPAWDMLLELYAAELGSHSVSISSLCIASAVPPSTALRWITRLQTDGWITRTGDPVDGRRSFVSLSTKGIQAMDAFFGRTGCPRGL